MNTKRCTFKNKASQYLQYMIVAPRWAIQKSRTNINKSFYQNITWKPLKSLFKMVYTCIHLGVDFPFFGVLAPFFFGVEKSLLQISQTQPPAKQNKKNTIGWELLISVNTVGIFLDAADYNTSCVGQPQRPVHFQPASKLPLWIFRNCHIPHTVACKRLGTPGQKFYYCE